VACLRVKTVYTNTNEMEIQFVGSGGLLVVMNMATALPDSGVVPVEEFGVLSATNLAGVENFPQSPVEFRLEQNYPNPFNPKTVVSCQLPVASTIRLVVYDLMGREVKVLMDEQKAPGRYQVEFDGAKLSSGVYIYRLTARNYVESKRMMLLR
jgi:hypothetical protein